MIINHIVIIIANTKIMAITSGYTRANRRQLITVRIQKTDQLTNLFGRMSVNFWFGLATKTSKQAPQRISAANIENKPPKHKSI
jgi:hypothetical protein